MKAFAQSQMEITAFSIHLFPLQTASHALRADD